MAAEREVANTDRNESVEIKRRKTDRGDEDNEPECENILSGFQTSSVLSESAREKIMFISGKVISGQIRDLHLILLI